MKVLHTADWHIGQFKGPVENGVNLRSEDTKKCLEFMVETARVEKPDIVCVSGDIFHQEQIGPVRYSDEMVTAATIIDALSETAKFVVVMRGTPNHDGAGQFRVLTKMLSHNKKVAVVTEPTVIATPLADIACIPGFDKQEFRAKFSGLSAEEENLQWTEYISQMVLGLRARCDSDNPTILMAHYTVPGCNTESGQTSFFANFEPVIPREALQTADYDGAFIGHIHRPQSIFGLSNVFYSGAINRMNFNDEGQDRGFYIHEFTGKELSDSKFVMTPARRFHTINWTRDDVAEYLRSGNLFLSMGEAPSLAADSIVRIRYSCTSDQKKALNIPVLQTDLYNIGAFYVSDIEADSTIDVTNRGLLAEENDPLANLKKWLEEKCYKEPEKIVELAEPIIAAAMKQSNTAEIHGVFKPISISVKNYRNYKEESFDFGEISFCTINGVNGAGKSSLFMDAICDCLYEETREGDNKAWIRGTEDARSGSIEFIFEIGEKRFRVVRTRTKSGRPTLNLSQMDEGGDEWLNLSKERVIDTQSEIERILGMDSMTFRSCALIMQDQYGLFLQAKKDERMAILGSLLGLGIYGIMEMDARKRLGDAKRNYMAKKEQVKVKNEFINSKGDPQSGLKDVERIISANDNELKVLEANRHSLKKTMESYDAAREKKEKDARERSDLQYQIKTARIEADGIDITIAACNTLLANADDIRAKAKEYEESHKIIEELKADTIRYEVQKKALDDLGMEQQRYENIIQNCKLRNAQIEKEMILQKLSGYDDFDSKLEQLEQVRTERESVLKKREQYYAVFQEWTKTKSEYNSERQLKVAGIDKTKEDLESCLQSKKFIADSGCPDIGNAKCHFLDQAKANVERIPYIEQQIKASELAVEVLDRVHQHRMEEYQAKSESIGYDAGRLTELETLFKDLSVCLEVKKQADEAKLIIARLEAEKESNDKTIATCNKNLLTVKLKGTEITEIVSSLQKSVEEYQNALELERALAHYVEDEKKLPVYEERLKNAEDKKAALRKTILELEDKEIIVTEDMMLADEELQKFSPDLEQKIMDIDIEIQSVSNQRTRMQITKGTLMQKVEDIELLMKEVHNLTGEIISLAETADRYDALKQAFSQDGVPHQIIRNIVPHITDAANNILGAMTGGTMGVEFVMEKTVKGKDGDKATLDVLINEYGKTTLPYASKSGGEKVKASLAVILALAETKTTAAGIQLGMLFIDEPPFLDDDGTQAYVDSLETIRERYPDVKIMAITHDDAMKARFNQSITVIKTEDGSKVIY